MAAYTRPFFVCQGDKRLAARQPSVAGARQEADMWLATFAICFDRQESSFADESLPLTVRTIERNPNFFHWVGYVLCCGFFQFSWLFHEGFFSSVTVLEAVFQDWAILNKESTAVRPWNKASPPSPYVTWTQQLFGCWCISVSLFWFVYSIIFCLSCGPFNCLFSTSFHSWKSLARPARALKPTKSASLQLRKFHIIIYSTKTFRCKLLSSQIIMIFKNNWR